MPAITADNAASWQILANLLDGTKPSVDRMVYVNQGKHKGKQGRVIRHFIDKFADAYRYGSDASHHMSDMAGRYGYCVQIDTGSERFFTKADYCGVISPLAGQGV